MLVGVGRIEQVCWLLVDQGLDCCFWIVQFGLGEVGEVCLYVCGEWCQYGGVYVFVEGVYEVVVYVVYCGVVVLVVGEVVQLYQLGIGVVGQGLLQQLLLVFEQYGVGVELDIEQVGWGEVCMYVQVVVDGLCVSVQIVFVVVQQGQGGVIDGVVIGCLQLVVGWVFDVWVLCCVGLVYLVGIWV